MRMSTSRKLEQLKYEIRGWDDNWEPPSNLELSAALFKAVEIIVLIVEDEA